MTGIVFQKITVMFLILAAGILCCRWKLIDEEGNRKLSNLLLLLVNPVVIFVSYQMEYDSRPIRNLILAFLLGLLCFALQIAVCSLLIPAGGKSGLLTRKKENKNYQIERLCAVYSNCGFIGIPLINSLFGREGVFYLTGYLTIFYLFLWSHGVILMTGKADRRTTIKNLCSPAIIGVLLGLFCFAFQILLPDTVVEALSSIGSMNTPLAMLVAGAALGQTSLRSCVGNVRIYYISMIRLMIIPFCLILLFQFLPFSPVLLLTTLIAASCPVGACCTMFALTYGKDGAYASQIFTVTTLLCIVTIPFVVAAAGIVGIG